MVYARSDKFITSANKADLHFTLAKENIEKNQMIISDDFGSSVMKKNSYIWQKHGPGYHYTIGLKPHKVIIRYTGKAKQMERKIKALRKRILR